MGLCRREAHHIQGSLGTRENPDKVKALEVTLVTALSASQEVLTTASSGSFIKWIMPRKRTGRYWE